MSSAEAELEKQPLQSKRIFVNHVNTYQGKNFAKYLSQCVVGASLDEVEEEEEEQEEEEDKEVAEAKVGLYEVVGTVKDQINYDDGQLPNSVKEIIKFTSRDELYEQLLDCDIIIYDITADSDQIEEATWAASQLHADIEKFDKSKPRMFILISTVMTWARSKPLDPEDPEIPFTEDDYRRRKPHPNFKEHISAEKMILKLGKTNKSKLSTFVVASGLTYGGEEDLFHCLFKSAWHNEQELVCYGNGRNIIPTIHVKDLAAVLQNIADGKPKVRYIVAVDDSKCKLKQIVRAVSKALSTGKIKNIPQNEALLDKQVKQEQFDMLLVNLRMDAVFAKESMHIKWVSETGMVDNMTNLVKEYKEERGLLPMRVFIHGPPAAGKSTVIEQLCSHYKLHHIRIKDVVDEQINKMQKYIEDKAKQAEMAAEEAEKEEEEAGEEADESDVEEEEDLSAEYEEMLEMLKENRAENNGRLEDTHIIRFFREKLMSKPCQNQGFILDGFPKTIEQAKELFAVDDEAAEEAEDGGPDYNVLTMPELIVSLDATDEFLRNRIMNLPENVVFGTHNTEEGLTRRLLEFRSINTEEDTVLNYFDELEFHPEHIDVTKDTSVKMRETVDVIVRLMGQPRNYGPTPEELSEVNRVEMEAKMKKDATDRAEVEKHEAEEAELRKKRHDEWTQRLEEVRREEQELLEAQSIPLRNYLMKHVMPTLTLGLRDCVAVRPDDPIDYLAEYLFRNNPQVD